MTHFIFIFIFNIPAWYETQTYDIST